ncbi:hypothetical protein KOR34_44910 [Posidoniimonas corsicana]|uniref:Uncharacterized protein n=1 Tax=Posidoniimonas corsicana TaxID=1938618 RepID=A0A5C5UXM7_9BACT|nr:hypothetical protein [Posidoniimonas corsicana]TWT31116.1 hypothetical protein KOR34_44910 [Posidoniimonas corsicana]
MRTAAVVCFAMAALTGVVGVKNIIADADQATDTANLVGYVIGSLFLPFVFTIGGLAFWGKAKREREDADRG